MDFEPEAIFAEVKKNKLAIPAILVGVGIGLYLLYKNGSNSPSVSPADNTVTVPSQTGVDPGNSSGGSTDTGLGSALTDLQTQLGQLAGNQQNLAGSYQSGLNDLSSQLYGALNQLAGQTQSALQSFAQQPSNAYDIGSELSAITSSLNGQLSHLYSDYSLPSLPSISTLTPNVPVTETRVSLPVQQEAFNLGNFLGNLVKPVLPQPTATPKYGSATPLNLNVFSSVGQSLGTGLQSIAKSVVNYSDIAKASGYISPYSTAPKISPNLPTANALQHLGQSARQIQEN